MRYKNHFSTGALAHITAETHQQRTERLWTHVQSAKMQQPLNQAQNRQRQVVSLPHTDSVVRTLMQSKMTSADPGMWSFM